MKPAILWLWESKKIQGQTLLWNWRLKRWFLQVLPEEKVPGRIIYGMGIMNTVWTYGRWWLFSLRRIGPRKETSNSIGSYFRNTPHWRQRQKAFFTRKESNGNWEKIVRARTIGILSEFSDSPQKSAKDSSQFLKMEKGFQSVSEWEFYHCSGPAESAKYQAD